VGRRLLYESRNAPADAVGAATGDRVDASICSDGKPCGRWPELYEAVLAVRRAEAELFAMFTDADVVKAVRWRY
jgi:glutamine synthetase